MPRSGDLERARLPISTLAVVVAATTLSLLPGFLIGTLSVTIRSEFGFGETQLGLLILIYMGISALSSAPLGQLVERVGAVTGLRMSLVSVAVCCFGIAATARSWWHLALWLLFAGFGSAGVYPSSNLAIVRRIDPTRQGVTFGIKQASIPAATFLGGLAVPLVDVALGWRGIFVLVGVGVVAVAVLSGPIIGVVDGRSKDAIRATLAYPPLIMLALGAALAVGGIQPIAVFGVPYAVQLELSASAAGIALAVASVFGVAMRVAAGAAADRWPDMNLFGVIAVFLLIGAASMSVFAAATTLAVYMVALTLGVALGWSWNGMFHFAVVRGNPEAPAAASSVTQAGLLGGVALGPPLFGATAEFLSFRVGWLACGVAMLLGCGFLLAGGRMLSQRVS